jgi:drug/metabolite transporter (DMT)-like permease
MPRLPKQLYLWIAILIFGASNSITRKLNDIGAQHFVEGRNPISFCNVLFVGNLCALIVLVILHRNQWNPMTLRQLSRREWLSLITVAILAGAIAPGLIFQALALTSVNNVVFLGRLESPLALLLSIWLLREHVNAWLIGGGIVSSIGVTLAFLLQPMMQQSLSRVENNSHFLTGEVLVVLAAIALAASTILGRANLARVPLGIFSVFRTALGTVIFFVAAMLLYGPHHFTDIFSPFLWEWMLIYGPLIVVVGQSFWVWGLRATSISAASLVSSFTPFAGILAAYLILGEVPTAAQYIGGSIVLIGIGLSQIGIWNQVSLPATPSRLNITGNVQEIEGSLGFRGV